MKKYTNVKVDVSKTQRKFKDRNIIGFHFVSETKLPKIWPMRPSIDNDLLKLNIYSCKDAIQLKEALEETYKLSGGR